MGLSFDEMEERAAEQLYEFTTRASTNDVRIPSDVLAEAKAIGVHWGGKGGAIVALQMTPGLVCAKLADGMWSCPVPVTLGELSIGFTFGGETKELITVVTTDRLVERVSNMFSDVSTEVSYATGSKGENASPVQVEGADDIAPIHTYTKDPRGFMATASVGGRWYHTMKKELRERYGEGATELSVLTGITKRLEWEHSPLLKALLDVVPFKAREPPLAPIPPVERPKETPITNVRPGEGIQIEKIPDTVARPLGNEDVLQQGEVEERATRGNP